MRSRDEVHLAGISGLSLQYTEAVPESTEEIFAFISISRDQRFQCPAERSTGSRIPRLVHAKILLICIIFFNLKIKG